MKWDLYGYFVSQYYSNLSNNISMGIFFFTLFLWPSRNRAAMVTAIFANDSMAAIFNISFEYNVFSRYFEFTKDIPNLANHLSIDSYPLLD